MRALELNGNGVRSLKFVKHEFYPLPSHKRDTDLEARLVERERFNSLQTPYGVHHGKPAYEILN